MPDAPNLLNPGPLELAALQAAQASPQPSAQPDQNLEQRVARIEKDLPMQGRGGIVVHGNIIALSKPLQAALEDQSATVTVVIALAREAHLFALKGQDLGVAETTS